MEEQQTDEQLIALVARGDQAALATLYNRYSSLVIGIVSRIVIDRNLSEEILQETFWRVWNKAETFDGTRGSFKTWMVSIARRHAIDIYRRQKVRPQIEQGEGATIALMTEPDDVNVLESVSSKLDGDALKQALEKLPTEQRVVIEKSYFEGKTRREIAHETGIPLGTIHTRARLGLRQLSDVLRTYRWQA